MQPKLLVTLSGEKIKTADEWEKYRRGECLALLTEYVYGKAPTAKPERLEFSVEEKKAINKIVFEKVKISFDGFSFYARLFYKKSKKPLPTIVYMMHNSQVCNSDIENEPNCKFIPIEDICERGYAVAVFYTIELHHDGRPDARYEGSLLANYSRPREECDGNEWASISAWAFAASRIMDYIETRDELDRENVAICGHSRGGKTALWTGATDPRFSYVISNSSGCMGAAMLRGKLGEHVQFITDYTDWFAKNLARYAKDEEMLPVDQHMLLALVAPRLLYIKSDVLDEWSDPISERRSARLASEVYELYGLKGAVLPEESEIEVAKAYHDGAIGYHVSDGDHKIRREDWEKYLAFWEKHRS
jgi:dienelactone hydrolase